MGTVHMFPLSTSDPRSPGGRVPSDDDVTFDIGGLHGELCTHDGAVTWTDGDGEIDGMDAVTRLFGSFRLAGRATALSAPGGMVFVYVPGPARNRSLLAALPEDTWMELAPDLWARTDGAALLLSPTDPVLATNLDR